MSSKHVQTNSWGSIFRVTNLKQTCNFKILKKKRDKRF